MFLLLIFAPKKVGLPGFPNQKATKISNASYLVARTHSYSYSLQDLDENLTNEDVKRDISRAFTVFNGAGSRFLMGSPVIDLQVRALCCNVCSLFAACPGVCAQRDWK